jgi:hypothetical protein
MNENMEHINVKAADLETHVFDSFVKEKHIILNYIYELILFAAKEDDIKAEDIFVNDQHKKRADKLTIMIKSFNDARNIKNRVNYLLMKY